MTTWLDLVTDIRADLRDPSGTKYPDATLLVWVKDAVRDYSRHFPLERIATLTLSGSAYALPTDFINDIYLMSPDQTYLEKRDPRPGIKYNTTVYPESYYLRGGLLYLNAPTSEAVILVYDSIHNTPRTDVAINHATQTAVTVPDSDLELIRLYVSAKSTERTRTRQSALDRFDPGSGRRDDNPMAPEVENLMLEYRMKLGERYPSGTIRLYRPGARR